MSGTVTFATNTTISAASPTKEVVKANQAELVAWLIMNVWPSHLGLPLLISTILLARHIRRHATFINLCITWMVVGFSSSLLLYAGFQTGPEPPKPLCIIQASLLYGQPGMTSLSAFGLVFQVFYVVRSTFREKDPHNHETLRKWSLVIAPYVAFAIFAGWTAYVGSTSPDLVSRQRRFFYCSVKSTFLTNSITIFSFLVLFVTIILECWIAYLTYCHWRVLRATELNEKNGMELSLIIRTSAFGLWVTLGMSLSVLSLRAPDSPIPDLALATMGSAVVLVFGTQKDVIRAWQFWRHDSDGLRHDRPPTPLDPVTYWEEKRAQPRRQWFSCFGMGRRSQHAKPSQKMPPFISHPVLKEDYSIPQFGTAI